MESTSLFQSKFREFAAKNRLFESVHNVIVAVSGGVDSMSLLHLLAGERRSWNLTMAHVNHGLRGNESDEDENFLRRQSQRYGLNFRSTRVDTRGFADGNGLGIQAAARELRYAFLHEVMKETDADVIATAHHADDNAETILLHLARGAGIQGLSGISPNQRGLIRPFLFAEKEEITAYAQGMGVEYRNDSSNEKDYYSRNFIRHHVIPLLKQSVNPGIAHTLLRTGEFLRDLESFLQGHATQALERSLIEKGEGRVILSIPVLLEYPAAVRSHAMMSLIHTVFQDQLEYAQVESLLHVMDLQTGKSVELRKNLVAVRDRTSLVIVRRPAPDNLSIVVEPDREYMFRGHRFGSELVSPPPHLPRDGAEYIDAGRLAGKTLVLRVWKEGDAFVPLGMKTEKKVSDFFVDEKVSLLEKETYPILETNDGEVIWVCGKRIDERFKITEHTTRALRLTFSRLHTPRNGQEHQG